MVDSFINRIFVLTKGAKKNGIIKQLKKIKVMDKVNKEIKEECKSIYIFINEWIKKNPHSPSIPINEHNKQFKKDFKNFFDNTELKHESWSFWGKDF